MSNSNSFTTIEFWDLIQKIKGLNVVPVTAGQEQWSQTAKVVFKTGMQGDRMGQYQRYIIEYQVERRFIHSFKCCSTVSVGTDASLMLMPLKMKQNVSFAAKIILL